MKKLYIPLFILLVAIVSCGQDLEESPKKETLNRWKDQTIYFVMIDRFYDGDSDNNIQSTNMAMYGTGQGQWSGGDFRGLIEKLDYIQDLGFTAIWITPPVLNQWWDETIPYGGFHGYWASSFTNVDPHYGTLEEYKEFVQACHTRGMRVIQDIVCNHTANYFSMDGEFGNLTINSNGYPMFPQEPFFSNSIMYYLANNPSSNEEIPDEYNAFHWTPDITDWNDWHQLTNYQASSLSDINTENPLVLKYMKEWFGYWIYEVGIDGYRVDTMKNVPKWFWREFTYSTDAEEPGIMEIARRAGKDDFIMIGEVHTPGDENEDATAGGYTMDEEGNRIMDTVLYYPMFTVIQDVFSKGEATKKVKLLFDNLDGYYHPKSIDRLVTFIDNHDKTRFRAGNSRTKTELALLFIYTTIGIPCVYYGTEQEMTITRPSMFEGGHQEDIEKKDYFIQDSHMYLFLKKLNSMRKKYEVLRRGDKNVVFWDDFGSGLLAFTRNYGEKKALVVFNTSADIKYAEKINTEFGSKVNLVNILDTKEKITTSSDGSISSTFKGNSCVILVPEDEYIKF
jgi:glycosidase